MEVGEMWVQQQMKVCIVLLVYKWYFCFEIMIELWFWSMCISANLCLHLTGLVDVPQCLSC